MWSKWLSVHIRYVTSYLTMVKQWDDAIKSRVGTNSVLYILSALSHWDTNIFRYQFLYTLTQIVIRMIKSKKMGRCNDMGNE